MKKYLPVALSLMMILTMVGCGNKTDGIANPMQEITDAELIKTYSHGLVLPEGSTEAAYYLYNGDLFEIRFEKNGVSYAARTAEADSCEDISGMYYEWTMEEADLAHLGLQGSAKRYIGEEETVDVVNWYDQGSDCRQGIVHTAALIIPVHNINRFLFADIPFCRTLQP